MPAVQFTKFVGQHAKGIAGSPSGFYIGLFDSSELALLNPDSGVRSWVISTGVGRTNGVAAWGDYVVTTNRDRGTATIHRASNGQILVTLGTGNLPWGVAADSGRAYIANYGSNSVTILDLERRTTLKDAPVGQGPVALVAGNGQVYVVHLSGQVFRLSADGQVLARARPTCQARSASPGIAIASVCT